MNFFFFVKPFGAAYNSSVYTFNLVSKALKLVYQGKILTRPYYGKNNWILLNLGDENIYKIRSTGEDLIQLTTEHRCFYPHWNYDYSKIGYRKGDTATGIIMDIDGNKIDTLPPGFAWNEFCTWSAKDMVITNACDFVNVYDITLDTFFTIYKFQQEPLGCGLGVTVLDDGNTVIWSHSDGLYKTTISDHVTVKLWSSCNSKELTNPSYSPLSGKILWQKIEYTPGSGRSAKLYVKASIVMTDKDGNNQETIELPDPF